MNQGAFHPEPTGDPQDGTAVIPEVTPEMMDAAAHRAAEMADGVAHHTLPSDAHAHDAPADEATADRTIEGTVDEAVARASETAEAPIGAVGEILAETSDAAQAAAAESGDPAAETAARGQPAATDAFGQYNAKVFEMVRSNMASATALVAALVQARSVPEAVALNADHLRRQLETLTTQGRELATLAQTLALDALQPPARRDR